jgi:hypothetical protein
MWICLNNSFVSIVENEKDKNTVWVRSRQYDHLINFIDKMEGVNIKNITETPKRDYRYRISIDKFTLSKILAKAVCKIDYSNFKNSVPLQHGDLYMMYSNFWHTSVQYLDPSWNSRH